MPLLVIAIIHGLIDKKDLIKNFEFCKLRSIKSEGDLKE
jgi:hypothetical protein